MNPDTGDEPEDWFARFEREAREAARQRDPEAAPVVPGHPPVPPPASSPSPQPPPPTYPPQPTGYPPQQPPGYPPPAAAPPPGYPAGPAVPPPPQYPPTTQYPPGPMPVAPSAPPPLVPPAPAVPPGAWDQPTQAMEVVEPPRPPAAAPTAPGPGQDLVRAPLQPPAGAEPASALDSLFGEDRFREYEPGPDWSESPFANRGRSKELVPVGGGDAGDPPPPRQLGTLQKALIGVGGGLLAILALLGLFVLGTRLPDLLGPAPAVATPTASPTPTPTALPIGPVDPGTYRWDELLGGECLDPYVDAWQSDYTVVDCADPHPAQLVYRNWFPNPDLAADPTLPPTVTPGSSDYPGAEVLATQIPALCSAAGVVDLPAAGAYSDAQIQGAYPATAQQWDKDPSYYCFVSRSSGEPLTGSVAIPRTPAEPEPAG